MKFKKLAKGKINLCLYQLKVKKGHFVGVTVRSLVLYSEER